MKSCPRCGRRHKPQPTYILCEDCFHEVCDEGDFSGDYTDTLSDYRSISGLYERDRDEEQWRRLADSPLMQELIVKCMALYDSSTLKKIGNRIERAIE